MRSFLLTFFLIPSFAMGKTAFQSSLYSKLVEGPKLRARLVGVDLLGSDARKVGTHFKTDIAVGLLVETGSLDSKLSHEYSAKQHPYLERGTLNWRPLKFFKAKVGGINQEEHENPLFTDTIPFFGFSQKIHYKKKNFNTSFSSYLLAPSNQKLSMKLGSVGESSATLITHSLELGYEYKRFEVTGSAAYFKFENLNSSVAFNSLILGNSIIGATDANSRFKYKFEGLHFNLKISYDKFYLQGLMIHNNKAPVGKSDGLSIIHGAAYRKISYKLEYFQVESDTIPAFYNSGLYNVGRDGYGATLEHSLTSQDQLSISFYQTDTLKKELYHDKRTLVFINLNRKINLAGI